MLLEDEANKKEGASVTEPKRHYFVAITIVNFIDSIY